MYDPVVKIDNAKLSAELGYPSEGFYPKENCNEEELKYIISGNPKKICPKIPAYIHDQDHRLVDFGAWSHNPYALITLNLDTIDQKLAKAGFSLRVRFSMVSGETRDIRQIDMCIKTKLPAGIARDSNVLQFSRGEWEVELPSLRPDMDKMIAQNIDENPRRPAFFQSEEIRNADFFVKTIGGTLRSVYPSYEGFNHEGRRFVSVFQHTEDIINVFMTPYGIEKTGEDTEVEAEFLGLKGVNPGEITPHEFNRIKSKAMRLLDRTIVGADPRNIERNYLSKAARSLIALETVYGPPPAKTGKLDLEIRKYMAADFALAQRIRPEQISLTDIWQHMHPLLGKFQREIPSFQGPGANGFRPQF